MKNPKFVIQSLENLSPSKFHIHESIFFMSTNDNFTPKQQLGHTLNRLRSGFYKDRNNVKITIQKITTIDNLKIPNELSCWVTPIGKIDFFYGTNTKTMPRYIVKGNIGSHVNINMQLQEAKYAIGDDVVLTEEAKKRRNAHYADWCKGLNSEVAKLFHEQDFNNIKFTFIDFWTSGANDSIIAQELKDSLLFSNSLPEESSRMIFIQQKMIVSPRKS